MVEMVAIELYRMYNIVYDKFNSQSSGNTVTESYRACEMAASCNNVDEHHGGAVVFFCVERKDYGEYNKYFKWNKGNDRVSEEKARNEIFIRRS